MRDISAVLEFSRIEERLFGYFAFDGNRLSFARLSPIADRDELEKEHMGLKAAEAYFKRGPSLELAHVRDISSLLALLAKGGALSVQGLSDFLPFLSDIESLRAFTSEQKGETEISALSASLTDFCSEQKRIGRSLLPDLTLADDASPLLFSLRARLSKTDREMKEAVKLACDRYKTCLSSEQVTIRNGLPALAVSPESKNRVKGLIADISNTGGTVFVVPLEVLDIQNKIFELKEAEQQECDRIVKELSGLLADRIDALAADYDICLRLDSLFGRVRFGLSYNGAIASAGDGIYLEDLIHPLLDPLKAVSNTVSLGGGKPDILVITGPNAGGKTVLLKATALACLMNQKGLMVDCRGQARLKAFDGIFFVSGDSQSIMDSLSTFSGHIAAIDETLKAVRRDSLAIIDEIGQGTSPADGEAIGISVIDYLKRVGCLALLTSHYDGIKEKAFSDPACQVGAMIFDEKTIEPTFRYQEGMIGKSYALEVAGKLGLSEDIIREAKAYLSGRASSFEDSMGKLSELQKENLSLKKEYEAKLEELSRLSESRTRAIEALQAEKESIARQADEKTEELIARRKEELDAAFRLKRIDLGSLAELKGKLSAAEDSLRKAGPSPKRREGAASPQPLQAGDRVRVISLNNIGRLISIDAAKGRAEIDVDGISIKADPSDLAFVSRGRHKAASPAKPSSYDRFLLSRPDVSLECNLIGLYADEARKKMEKYLDSCLLAGLHQVRIIHGVGTGVLLKMVQQSLKKNPNVESFRFGGAGEGGVGATVVTLK